LRGNLSELTQRFSAGAPARGEMVLIISGANKTELRADPESGDSPARLAARVAELERAGLDPKAALKVAARELGLKRAEAYRWMVAQKGRA